MANIFEIAEQKAAEADAADASNGASIESFVCVCGSRGGGKSSLIQTFINPTKEDVPKPTIALEYTYGRRGSIAKDVAHVWELGGNSPALAELLTIVCTPARLPTNVFVVVADLSKPYDALCTAVRWCGLIRARVSEVLDKLRAKKDAGFASYDSITQAAQARLRLGFAQRGGAAVPLLPTASSEPSTTEGTHTHTHTHTPPAAPDASKAAASLSSPAVVKHLLSSLPEHPDARLIGSSAIPAHVVLVGGKFDALRDEDAAKRKAVLTALRYIGLCFGAHVVTVSSKDKGTLTMFRAFLNACVFAAEPRRGVTADASKPLAIPAGADTLESIGLPPTAPGVALVTRADVEAGSLEARLERFLAPVRAFFPPSKATSDADDDVDLSTAPPAPRSIAPGATVRFTDDAATLAPEPAIDAMRVRAAEELAAYVRDADRKLKMESKGTAGPSAPSAGAPAEGPASAARK